MKVRSVCVIACAALILAACSPVDMLSGTPLTSTETQLVGTWIYTGPGIVKTYVFNSDRTCVFAVDSTMIGSDTAEYVWEADGTRLSLYQPHGAILDPDEVDSYSFVSSTMLQIEGETYTKQ